MVRHDARRDPVRHPALRRREHEQLELGHVLDDGDDGHRLGLVRRGAHSVLEPRLPRRRGGEGRDGIDGDAAGVAHRGARHLPGDRPEVRVPPPLGGAGRRAARRAHAHAALRHPVRARRHDAQHGAGIAWCRTIRGARAHVARGGGRPALSAVERPHARPHLQHGLRAGGGGRAAGEPGPLPAVLPRAPALLPGEQRRVRLRVRGRVAAVPLAAHRADARLHADPRARRRAARRARGRVGRRLPRDADRAAGHVPDGELRRAAAAPPRAERELDRRLHGDVVRRRGTAQRRARDGRLAACAPLRVPRAQVGRHRRHERLDAVLAARPRRARRALRAPRWARASVHRIGDAHGPRLPPRARLPPAPRLHLGQRLRQLLHLHRQASDAAPRLSGRARVLDLAQRRPRAGVGAVRRVGAVGHEGRGRRVDRAQAVPRERALRLLHRPARDDSRRLVRLRGPPVRVLHAGRRARADEPRPARRPVLRRHARPGDRHADVERLAASRARRRLPAHGTPLSQPRPVGEHPPGATPRPRRARRAHVGQRLRAVQFHQPLARRQRAAPLCLRRRHRSLARLQRGAWR